MRHFNLKQAHAMVFVLMGPVLAGYPCTVHGQFLKKLLNDVKQTAQGRADSKTNQETNKALDKADGSLQKQPAKGKGTAGSGTGSTSDTSSMNKVLGAFAKAAADNPNDTSSADLTMKALGLLAGGGGVSAADSAAAIKGYMTAEGGGGVFYQSLTTMTLKGKPPSKDTSSTFLQNNGEGRTEMRMPIPGASTNKMIIIGHASQPRYSVSLYPESKTYSLNVIDTSLINGSGGSYQVTKLGEETVAGYHCMHARMTSHSLGSSGTTTDVWTSTGVPGYAIYKKLMSAAGVTLDMVRALEKAGCAGFMVKMQIQNKDCTMTSQLFRAESRSMPASLFEIPAGYKESQGNMFTHMLGAK